MQRLSYTDKTGRTISFDSFAPFVFWKISGLSMPAVETLYSQSPSQHGYTLRENLFEGRHIRLTGHIHGKSGENEMYRLRNVLGSIANPARGTGILQYENSFNTWQIPAFCSAVTYQNKLREIQTIDVDFECPMPFFMPVSPSILRLSYVSGGFKFPMRTPNKFGVLGYQAIADNDGDVPTPAEFWVGGGSTNPTITNSTTGEFIKVERAMEPSDQLYINTDPEALEVSLITTDPQTNERVKSNAYGHLSFNSTLFSLLPGKNVLTFESDNENKTVKIEILFRKRVVGV